MRALLTFLLFLGSHGALAINCSVFSDSTLPSALFSYDQLQGLSTNQRTQLDKWAKAVERKATKTRTTDLGSMADAGFEIVSPQSSWKRVDLERRHLDKAMFEHALLEKLQSRGLAKNYVPTSKMAKVAFSVTKTLHNTLQLALPIEHQVILPLLAKLNIRLDTSDPRVKSLLSIYEREGWDAARPELSALLREHNPWLHDPVAVEQAFNFFVTQFNRKILALGLAALKVYVLVTTNNETSPTNVVSDKQEEVSEVLNDNDLFFLESLKKSGIDPIKNPEEYREMYLQYYGAEPPAPKN